MGAGMKLGHVITRVKLRGSQGSTKNIRCRQFRTSIG